MNDPRPRLWPMVALFGVLWLVAAITSSGFLEDDAWTHYLYSRFAFQQPAYLLDVWGRPVCTGLYALAAPWAGMFGCRLISLGLVAVSMLLTMRTARALQIDDRVSAIFLLGQPMLFLHSLSVMTEIPFAVLLIGAFLCFIERRWWLMALLVSLLPLARPEGFGFLLLGIAVLVAYRRFLALPLLVVPLIAWTWMGWWMWGASQDRSAWWWLIDNWPYSATSAYGRGWLFSFVGMMPVLIGMGVPLVIVGIRNVLFGSVLADRAACFLLIAIPLLMLVAHSLLWWLGKMASYGEIRYLLIVAPFWALLAAAGWKWSKLTFSPTLVAAIGLLIVFGFKATTLRASFEGEMAAEVTQWYLDSDDFRRDHPRVLASHPAVYANLGLPIGGWNPESLRSPADDAIVFWEPKCGPTNADSRLVTTVAGLEATGWKTIKSFEGGWVVMVRNDRN